MGCIMTNTEESDLAEQMPPNWPNHFYHIPFLTFLAPLLTPITRLPQRGQRVAAVKRLRPTLSEMEERLSNTSHWLSHRVPGETAAQREGREAAAVLCRVKLEDVVRTQMAVKDGTVDLRLLEGYRPFISRQSSRTGQFESAPSTSNDNPFKPRNNNSNAEARQSRPFNPFSSSNSSFNNGNQTKSTQSRSNYNPFISNNSTKNTQSRHSQSHHRTSRHQRQHEQYQHQQEQPRTNPKQRIKKNHSTRNKKNRRNPFSPDAMSIIYEE